jgi:hypothetical protein
MHPNISDLARGMSHLLLVFAENTQAFNMAYASAVRVTRYRLYDAAYLYLLLDRRNQIVLNVIGISDRNDILSFGANTASVLFNCSLAF